MKRGMIVILMSTLIGFFASSGQAHPTSRHSSARQSVALSAPGLTRPTIVSVWDGLDVQAGASDAGIAVGTTTIVSTNNHVLASFSKQDGTPSDRIDFINFHRRGTLRHPFDPRIVYDHINRRFVIVVSVDFTATESGYIGFIVSRNENPTQISDWCALDFIPTPLRSVIGFPDFPLISINPVKGYLLVTSSLYRTNGSIDPQQRSEIGTSIVKIRLSDLYACSSDSTVKEFNGLTIPGASSPVMGVGVAQWLDGYDSDYAYFVANRFDSNPRRRRIFAWRMPNSYESDEPPTVYVESEPDFDSPPNFPRINAGHILNNPKARVRDAYLKHDIVRYTFDEIDPLSGRSVVTMASIDFPPVNLLTRYGANEQADFAFQTFMLNRVGDIIFLFNTTKTTDPTLSAGIQIATDTTDRQTIQADLYSGPNTNAYDYNGAGIDPNQIDMWFVGTYSAPTNLKKTKIIRVRSGKQVFLPIIRFR